VLSTLIDNSAKVNDLPKSKELDDPTNTSLFGDKFEKNLSKCSTSKKQSFNMFSGLQKNMSSSNNSSTTSHAKPKWNQPFPRGPFSVATEVVGGNHLCHSSQEAFEAKVRILSTPKTKTSVQILSTIDYPNVHPLVKDLFQMKIDLEIFSPELVKIDSRSSNSTNSSGVRNPFNFRTNSKNFFLP